MQAASDIFLGWERIEGIDGRRRDFYVRQLRDWKGIAEPQTMVPDGLRVFGEVCRRDPRPRPRPLRGPDRHRRLPG